MRAILIYDISTEEPSDQKRLNNLRKIARKYLNHIQKSVFEGNITLSNLERLKVEILNEVDMNRDSVILYIFDDRTRYERMILTNTEDPTANLI